MATDARLRIGLTGGIGSGKSTVADGFARRGAHVVDADEIAHRLTGAGGAAMAEIERVFGSDMLTAAGALDRDKMRALAFSDDAARARLESILHPLIRAITEREVEEGAAPYAMLVIPLLLESGRGHVDRVLVVDCPEELQIERVMRRSGLARATVEAIMARQLDRISRLRGADDVIDNGGAPDALETQIEALHARYLALAQGPGL